MAGKVEIVRVLLDRLKELSYEIQTSIAQQDFVSAGFAWQQIETLVGLLEMSWPSVSAPKEIGELRRHCYFIGYYIPRRNSEMIQSNAQDCSTDLGKLELALDPLRLMSRPGLLARVQSLPESLSKVYALEAISALEVGAYRAAIVTAGASLEDFARRSYETAFGNPSKDLDFNEVIEKLEQTPHGRLKAETIATLHMLRVYRNLTAHPSDLKDPEGYAAPLVELACKALER